MAAKPRTNQKVIRALEYALEQANMKNCAVAPEHKEAMRLYLRTWVAGPIEDALQYLRGEKDSWGIIHWQQ